MYDYVPEPDLSQLRVIFNRARHDAGLTYDQLAARSGLSRQTLINLSQGRHYGDLQTWLRLSATFEVGLDDLLSPVWPDEER
ncbi:helix-turn-helix transcriptional regulator [Brevibacterium album]|uniref:helix-turn-helix transcriptional regulator n=1 Tax=Brevibacterium album TaxID=417948 RepID=UPI0004117880|nr:helix-turn-helix transcriptional regulator [Brevibacterium album]